MGQWVGSGQMTNNLINLDLIDIIQFCLKIYHLWTPPPMGGCMGGWVDGWFRHPYLRVDGWVNGWAHVKPLKSNKSWPNRDNSIMNILDILLDILLKLPQPFIGLFFIIRSRATAIRTAIQTVIVIILRCGLHMLSSLSPWFTLTGKWCR